ncbi:MAG: Sir2 family NAD-dependent protein deacetylase [Bacteroidales bacterium]|nr:Sir2 family NAD-dependent protein deacetylase [Bacteroidales bacterium]MDP3003042.1 Sir2 family NAD-dependent protein deacetylase [Bacteroidales bacterium]
MNEGYSERIERAGKAIQNAEKLVIGAGAGLSAAAGIEYNGKRFTENFKPFVEKYGMKDLYTSSFFPFRTQEEKWAYWARHISLNLFETPVKELYISLIELVSAKDYFVITTNVEGQFRKAGVDKSKFFEIQGNYGYFQCEKGCHDKLYFNEHIVVQMLSETSDCTIPSSLVPKCPVCGGNMEVNLRKDNFFVQDSSWYTSEGNYRKSISGTESISTVFIELGVGYNTPGIIRFPFETMVHNNPNALLIRVNRDHPNGMTENLGSTISFNEDMTAVIDDFRNY